MLQYLTDQFLEPTKTHVNEKVQYTGNTGTAVLSTANSNLDGSGTIATILSASGNGTLITGVTIKATGTTTRGMIRFFIADGETFTHIIGEVDVPARIQSGTQNTWSINCKTKWYLKSGWFLGASTQNAENFVVLAQGLDMSYPSVLNGL